MSRIICNRETCQKEPPKKVKHKAGKLRGSYREDKVRVLTTRITERFQLPLCSSFGAERFHRQAKAEMGTKSRTIQEAVNEARIASK